MASVRDQVAALVGGPSGGGLGNLAEELASQPGVVASFPAILREEVLPHGMFDAYVAPDWGHRITPGEEALAMDAFRSGIPGGWRLSDPALLLVLPAGAKGREAGRWIVEAFDVGTAALYARLSLTGHSTGDTAGTVGTLFTDPFRDRPVLVAEESLRDGRFPIPGGCSIGFVAVWVFPAPLPGMQPPSA